MIEKYDYEYYDISEDCTSQYEGIIFHPGIPVEARYIHAAAKADAGNPLIEALPLPRTSSKDIRNAYTKPIYGYEFNPSKSKLQAFSEIGLLDGLRFPLPYHQRLEQENYRVLQSAYRLKELMITEKETISIGAANDMAPIGYSLIGASGSGKSSSLKILLSQYPQVIEHNIKGVGKFFQIVYLIVNVVPNSNFKALYKEIARAIDKALGYSEPFYESMIKRGTTLGDCAIFISKLFEKFSVGELFIDEIQLMSFNESKENSFQTLAVLSNETKTPLVAIGTESAVNKMFNQQWTARRIGASITSDRYCSNIEFFNLILSRLCVYQWGRKKGEFSDEARTLLYQKTNGIIAYLILMYARIQMDIVQNDPEDAYSPSQINRIAKLYFGWGEKFSHIQAKRSQNKINRSAEAESESEIQSDLHNDLDDAIQKEQINNLISNADQDENVNEMRKFVIDRIGDITDDYNTETISNAFNVILSASLRKNEMLDQKQILRKTLERLKNGTTDLRPKAHKPSKETLARIKSELTY